MEMKQLTEERNQIFLDTINGRIPKRVLISPIFQIELAMQYSGFNLKKDIYSVPKMLEAIDIFTRDIDTDTVNLNAIRFPQVYKTLESKNWIMGGDGFLQHPDVSGMDIEDYDDLIAKPYSTIVETILPKVHTALAGSIQEAAEAKSKAFFTQMTTLISIAQKNVETAVKYGKSTYPMTTSSAEAPFDFLSDQLRSFSKICIDIRKIPNKVIAACDALQPLMVKMGANKGAKGDVTDTIFYPLHMATYMREKDFAKFYWPTFKKTIEIHKAMGYTPHICLESDFTRYLDYLQDLPNGLMFWIEDGDAQLFKDKLGKDNILTGFYPLNLLRNGTIKECEDEAKRLTDILAPGGGYIFGTDKTPLVLKDINMDNLKAVIKTIKEYGKY